MLISTIFINCLVALSACLVIRKAVKVKLEIDVGDGGRKKWLIWGAWALLWLGHVLFALFFSFYGLRKVFPYNPADPERGLGWCFSEIMLTPLSSGILAIVMLVRNEGRR